ncbi:hypothetical protein F1880_005217 [Penicillium rolfsii]|nr:hypothetical protein F1880_005217 [Penicillium rolfsii]
MRFAAVTVALFAGLAAALPNGAESTVYQTEEVTITSCAPTVTNCPGRASETGAASVPVVTPSVPAGGVSGVSPVGSSSVSSAPAPVATTSVAPAPAGPSVTVVPVVHTTCQVVTSWSTIAVPTGSSPVGGNSGSSHASSSVAAHTSATAVPTSTPAFNGAGAVSGSLGFAGAAAVAAFFLA